MSGAFGRTSDVAIGIDRRLLRLQLSFFILVLGGRCSQLAVAWWTLQETGSELAFTNMVACSISAEVLSKPMLGWLGDRYNKILIVKITSVASTLTAISMLVLSAIGAFNPWTVGGLMILSSAIVGIRDPLQASIIPLFMPNDGISLALRTKSVMSSFSILIGPLLAGGLIYGGGIVFALTADLVAISAALFLVATIPTSIGAVDATEDRGTGNAFVMIYAGFKAVYAVKVEFYLALIAMIVNFSLYPFFTILIPLYVKDVIEYPVTYVGLLDSCFGLGVLIGSYKLIDVLARLFARDICISIGFALVGANLLVVGSISLSYLVALSFFFGGVGLMLINIPASTVRLLATPKLHRNRIFATVSFLSAAASPLGSFAMNVAIGTWGISSTISILGTTVLVLSLCIFLIPDFKFFMRTPDANLENAYVKKYPQAFR